MLCTYDLIINLFTFLLQVFSIPRITASIAEFYHYAVIAAAGKLYILITNIVSRFIINDIHVRQFAGARTLTTEYPVHTYSMRKRILIDPDIGSICVMLKYWVKVIAGVPAYSYLNDFKNALSKPE